MPQNLANANPDFYKPQRVQILLGGDVFYELLHGQIKLNDSSIILQNSQLGWVAAGTLNNQDINRTLKCHLLVNQGELDLRAFWELENLGIKDDPNTEDTGQSLERFRETVSYKNNRYEISLPWKRDGSLLENNFDITERRLKRAHKKNEA